ncbi:MAG: ankyrin repeat domain-containing protein [Sphingomonadales bacterium]
MRYFLFVFMAVVLAARPSLGADPARYPFLPHVIVGAAPFCEVYAAAAAEDFKPEAKIDAVDAFAAPSTLAADKVAVPIGWATREDVERITGKPTAYPDGVSLYLVDLDGSGVPEAVFAREGYERTVFPFTDWFVVENVSAEKLAIALDRFIAEMDTPRWELDPDRFGATTLFESRKGALQLQSGILGHDPLGSVGQLALVLLGGKPYWQAWISDNDPGYPLVMFFEPRSVLSAQLVCAVRVQPELRAASVHKGPAVGALEEALRPVLGRVPSTAESCMSGYGAVIGKASDRKFRITTSFQPWRAIPESNPSGALPGIGLTDDHEVANILRLWSLQSAWNRRQYWKIVAAFDPAVAELTARYRASFGVGEATARRWARWVAWRTVRASAGMSYDYLLETMTNEAERFFLYPSASPERLRARLSPPQPPSDPFAAMMSPSRHDVSTCSRPESDCGRSFTSREFSDLLRYSAINSYPADVLDLLLARGAGLEAGEESALMLAVEHPETVSLLLRAGASVRFRNPFGKTPLMMAAHMGRADTAALLLGAGAPVNAATYDAGDVRQSGVYAGDDDAEPSVAAWGGALLGNTQCVYGPAFGKRTALMYAAENGSVALIALLVEHGADVAATDSKGRTMADYLALNETLSKAERRRAQAILGIPP